MPSTPFCRVKHPATHLCSGTSLLNSLCHIINDPGDAFAHWSEKAWYPWPKYRFDWFEYTSSVTNCLSRARECLSTRVALGTSTACRSDSDHFGNFLQMLCQLLPSLEQNDFTTQNYGPSSEVKLLDRSWSPNRVIYKSKAPSFRPMVVR